MNSGVGYMGFSRVGPSEKIIINLIGFQVAWWLAVLLQQQSLPWLALLLIAHLALHSDRRRETGVIVLAATVGYLVDTLLLVIGLFNFSGHALLPPLWLAGLWACFAATLRQGLKPLIPHPILASLIGGIGGSGSYLLGAQLGAVELGYSTSEALLILLPIWMLLLPLLLWCSQVISCVRRRPQEVL